MTTKPNRAAAGGGLDLLHARVVFRDRSVVDVFDLALRFIAHHRVAFAKIALVALLPPLAATLAVAHVGGRVAAWLSALAFGFIAEIPFTMLASRLVFEDTVELRDVLRASFREIPRVIVMRVLWLVIFAIAALMLVIPALWSTSVTLFTLEIMLLERAGVGRAFGRALTVGSSSAGDALVGVLLLAFTLVAILVVTELAGRELVGTLLQFRLPAPAWTAGGSVLTAVGWFAAIPYLATARFFIYLNARTRAEGWDIQTRFAAIAARSRTDESTHALTPAPEDRVEPSSSAGRRGRRRAS